MLNTFNNVKKASLIICITVLLVACGRADDLINAEIPLSSDTQVIVENTIATTVTEPSTEPDTDNLDLNMDNSRYLFDVTKHGKKELQTLLNRVEEIHLTEREKYEGLDLVLILHGPDILLFTNDNYKENKPLVDLAARLDAFGMIDLKICETYMSMADIQRSEVPPFIESVPFAPREIERLTDIGYINL